MTVFALYVPEIPGERKEGERKKRGRREEGERKERGMDGGRRTGRLTDQRKILNGIIL